MAMNITSISGPILGGFLLACCRAAQRVWGWSDTEMILGLNWSMCNAQRIYITTSQGRVLSSRNLGVSWEPAPFALPGATARSTAFEGPETGVLWAYLALLSLYVMQILCYAAIRPQPRQRTGPPPEIPETLVEPILNGLSRPCIFAPAGR